MEGACTLLCSYMGEGESCAEAGPFVNPLFGDASTPQAAGQRLGMNPIWSPGDRPESAEQQGGLPMPPPPVDILSASAAPYSA